MSMFSTKRDELIKQADACHRFIEQHGVGKLGLAHYDPEQEAYVFAYISPPVMVKGGDHV